MLGAQLTPLAQKLLSVGLFTAELLRFIVNESAIAAGASARAVTNANPTSQNLFMIPP
jgi:hypothetical protein